MRNLQKRNPSGWLGSKRSAAPRSNRPRHRRSGSLYVAVMAVSTIVAIIGLSAITVAQAKLRRSQEESDVYAARMLALSAVENAMSDINKNGSWRLTYVNNVEYPATPITLNGGTITCKLVDADGDLNDDPSDPATLYGIGRVGNAVHVHRVEIEVSGFDMKITSSTWKDADAP